MNFRPTGRGSADVARHSLYLSRAAAPARTCFTCLGCAATHKVPARTSLRPAPPGSSAQGGSPSRQRRYLPNFPELPCTRTAWSWTALRPSCIRGFAVGNPMNMATVIAVYAALCKELGLALRFPGSTAAYQALMEITDANLLAKAMVWAGQNEACDGQAFNITNGDINRWENLWPRLADFFKLPCGSFQHLPLASFVSDKEPIWNRMVKKYGLRNYSYQEAVSWPSEKLFLISSTMSSPTLRRRVGSVSTNALTPRKCCCACLPSFKKSALSRPDFFLPLWLE